MKTSRRFVVDDIEFVEQERKGARKGGWVASAVMESFGTFLMAAKDYTHATQETSLAATAAETSTVSTSKHNTHSLQLVC